MTPSYVNVTFSSLDIVCILAVFIVLVTLVARRFSGCSLSQDNLFEEAPVSTFENISDGDNLKDPLLNAFENVESILVHHSGPFASNCIIGSKFRQVNDIDEFTKDGINILRHVTVSEEVNARLAVRMARFVGLAVDARCHDGTTTSMLMLCALAKIAVEKINEPYISSERHIWAVKLKETLETCLAHINSIKITEDDILARCAEFGIETTPQDIRGAIAYHMAMISSKGDENLSSKISHIIRSSPKKIYGMYRNIPLAVETEEPYILKRQEYDLGARANIGHMDHFNFRNNTQYMAEDVVLFATGNQINVHSMESGFLQSFISTDPRARADLREYGVDKGWEDHHGGTRRLVILSPLLDDPTLIEVINRFNYKHPDIKISWFNYHVNHKLRTSFNKTLHYMAGVPLFEDVMFKDATKSMIGLTTDDGEEGVDLGEQTPAFVGKVRPKVQLLGSFLAISNLYQRDEDVFHPLYKDPEAFKPYTEFCREIERDIQFSQDNITNPALDHDELTQMTSFYRSLTCQEIYDIEVGGSRHDQLANQTVYEDAIGAALSAVDEGVILGGYAHLASCFMDVENEIYERFHEAFVKVLMDSLRIQDEDLLTNFLYLIANDRWSYIVADRESYRADADAEDYVSVGTLDKEGLAAFLDRRSDQPVLVQAYGGYHEQFKRFHDILPKLANASHLVDMRTENDVGLA